MQPDTACRRISRMWPVVRRWALCWLATLALAVAGGCAVDGTAEEPAVGAQGAQPQGGTAGAGSQYLVEASSSPFPLLVPSFGFDTYDGDCEIGDDPFSACQ